MKSREPCDEAAKKDAAFLTPARCARIVTSVTGLADGYDLGSISGALVIFRRELNFSSGQVGAIAGVAYFAMAIGAPVAGMMADSLGRKKALAASYVFLIAGSLAMALAGGFAQMFAGRILLGLGIGAGFSVVTTYMTEVAPKSHRGCYVGLEDLFLVAGVSVGYSFNYFLSGVSNDWRWMLGLGAVPPAIAFSLLLLPQLPESPRWQVLRGNREQGVRDLRCLVGEAEAREMLEAWQEHRPACTWLELVKLAGGWRRRAVVASVGVMVVPMLAGIAMITVYLGKMLAQDMPERDGFMVTMLLGIMRVVILVFALFFLLDRVGRRPLLLASCAGVAASLGALAAMYAAGAALRWKIAGLVAYYVCFTLGLAAVPYVYSSEVLPTELRSKGVSLAIFLARLVAGCLTSLYPLAADAFGQPAVFAALSTMCCVCVAFLWTCAPETAEWSLEEIHHLFRRPDDPPSSARGVRSHSHQPATAC